VGSPHEDWYHDEGTLSDDRAAAVEREEELVEVGGPPA
jgi:hypothetical protein